MNLQHIAKSLGGNVRGNYVVVRFGHHGPADRSLKVSLEGRMVSSCTPTLATIPSSARIMSASNADYHSGSRTRAISTNVSATKARAVSWVYHRADGTPYLRVQRYDRPDGSKSYPQSQWNGADWAQGKPPGGKIPYRLPELAKAPGREVFICEGEKCADAVAKLGYLATTASEGAGKWTPELNKWFKGNPRRLPPPR